MPPTTSPSHGGLSSGRAGPRLRGVLGSRHPSEEKRCHWEMLVALLISEGMSALYIRHCKEWECFRAAQNLVGSQ